MSILHPGLKRNLSFLNSDQDQSLRVSGHVSVDRAIQLANSFWTLGRWQQPLPRNHGDAVTVGTLWGLGQVCGGTSMVMYRAATKSHVFFLRRTFTHMQQMLPAMWNLRVTSPSQVLSILILYPVLNMCLGPRWWELGILEVCSFIARIAAT